MIYFLFLPAALVLFVLFSVLTALEAKSGTRLFGAARTKFDARVERAAFVLQHVDWGAFVNDVARTGFERALHDIAHGTLMIVRFIERILTRTVRYLRARREHLLPQAGSGADASVFSQTASYLRRTLRRTRKVPENLPGQDQDAENVLEL